MPKPVKSDCQRKSKPQPLTFVSSINTSFTVTPNVSSATVNESLAAIISSMERISASHDLFHVRVPNRFRGMRDLAFFAVIFGICAENRGGKKELQIRAGAGFRVFMGWDARFAWGTERDTTSAKTASSQKSGKKRISELFVRIAVPVFK